MSTLIKICGVTVPEQAAMIARAGADMIGINFWPGSKRHVEPAAGAAIAAAAREARSDIVVVGVFVNPTDDEVQEADRVVGLDLIQLHGDETAARVAELGERAFKAAPVSRAADALGALAFPGPYVLLDAPTPDYGGSGESFDWSLATGLRGSGRRWLLAGGLDPDNVAQAIEHATPTGVDVASGVESAPGDKDPEKVAAFIAAVRRTA